MGSSGKINSAGKRWYLSWRCSLGVALKGTGTTGEEAGEPEQVDSLRVCESAARNVQSSILRGHKDYLTVTLVA